MAEIQEAVKHINQTHAEAKAAAAPGIPFGGQPILDKALTTGPATRSPRRPPTVMAERLEKPIEWDGFQGHPKHADGENAGTYAKKGVVFNDSSPAPSSRT
jgi:hypothetical protein